MADRIVLAITGASGSLYALRLLEVLLNKQLPVHLVISPAAVEVLAQETGRIIDLNRFSAADLLGNSVPKENLSELEYHHFRNFQTGIASGSFPTRGMVICPCSMGTIAAIAHGMSENLIHRAADVHLKERRKLIVVPRETPLSVIALENLTALSRAGVVVLPAMPGFYHRPQTVADMVDFVVARILDQLGVPHQLSSRWGMQSS